VDLHGTARRAGRLTVDENAAVHDRAGRGVLHDGGGLRMAGCGHLEEWLPEHGVPIHLVLRGQGVIVWVLLSWRERTRRRERASRSIGHALGV
jgi:hypothetical protein